MTPLWADTLIELVKNEVGLVITGHFCVDKMQRADAGWPVLDETTDESLLRRACDGVHRYGGKLFFQLSHSGIKGVGSVNGAPPKHPEDFTLEELDRLVEQFAFAAKKCKDCGADGVQVHNAHGYLLSNFLNPEENLRTDEYGGSLENRFRLIERILRAVREACGADFPMIVKADSNGCGDLPALLRLYERCGVDGVEVSGIDFNRRARQKTPFYLDALKAAREGISIPLPGRRRVLARDCGGDPCTGFPARVDEPRAHLRAGLCRKAQKRRAGREQMPCLQRLLHDLPQALCALRAASRRDRAVQNHPVVKKNGRAGAFCAGSVFIVR